MDDLPRWRLPRDMVKYILLGVVIGTTAGFLVWHIFVG